MSAGLHTSYAALSKLPSHFSARNAVLQHYQNLVIITKFSSSKYNPNVQFLGCSAYSNSPLPITLPSSMPNILPCVPTTFTTRTRGHYLETTDVNFLPVAVINVAYSIHNLPSSSSSFFSLGRLINISPQVQWFLEFKQTGWRWVSLEKFSILSL